jgi:drug/metabolite transporter (DMT)-like permease
LNLPTHRHTELDPRALSLMLGLCVVWGLGQVATKTALAEWPPMAQAALRSAGALLCLLAFARWRGIPMWRADGTLLAGVGAGALFALEFACIFSGLQYTGASRMAVLIYLAPFVVALGMPFIAPAERLSPRQWLGLALAFAGVAWAFADGWDKAPANGAAGPQWWGDVLGFAGAVFWGLTTLLIRASRLASASPEKTLAYQLGVSALLLAGAAAAVGERLPNWQQITAMPLAALLFQTVVITFASYLAWFWLVRHYAATRLAAFTLLTPITGLAFGVLLLGEPLTARLLFAVAAVGLGLWLINRRA